MTEGLRYAGIEDEEGPNTEWAAKLRIDLYDFAHEQFADSPNPKAETLLDFIKMERDQWIAKLPKDHPYRELIDSSNEDN